MISTVKVSTQSQLAMYSVDKIGGKSVKYLNDISKDCVGKVCKSLNSGDFKILKYNNSRNVDIQFLKTGFETSANLQHIRNGKVKDPYSPSVYGVGVVGTKYPPSISGVKTKEYGLWTDMLTRCYSDTCKRNNQLTKVVKFQKTLSRMSISTSGVIVKLGLTLKVLI